MPGGAPRWLSWWEIPEDLLEKLQEQKGGDPCPVCGGDHPYKSCKHLYQKIYGDLEMRPKPKKPDVIKPVRGVLRAMEAMSEDEYEPASDTDYSDDDECMQLSTLGPYVK